MPEKILIVDDDIDSLKLIGLMLQRNGYEVIAANAGTPGIAKAASEKPNLIILDVMMPDMDGYEVCRLLRENPATQGIPIIMFTAKTLIDDKVAGFEAGADDYLTKPTHPAELTSRVRAMLARGATSTNEMAAQTPTGKTIGVLGVKGGVGVSTIALNLGASAMQAGENPVVVDMNVGYGNIGLRIGYGSMPSMSNLLSRAPTEINAKALDGQIITHSSGLRLLLTSVRPKESQLNINPETAVALVNSLKKVAKPVILDLGSRLTKVNSRLLRELDQIILVIEPNRVSIEMSRELFQALELDGVNRSRVNIVVMTRNQTTAQTPWQDIEQQLGQEIQAIIAAAPELAFQSSEAQTPTVLFRPNSITANQLNKLAEDVRTK